MAFTSETAKLARQHGGGRQPGQESPLTKLRKKAKEQFMQKVDAVADQLYQVYLEKAKQGDTKCIEFLLNKFVGDVDSKDLNELFDHLGPAAQEIVIKYGKPRDLPNGPTSGTEEHS